MTHFNRQNEALKSTLDSFKTHLSLWESTGGKPLDDSMQKKDILALTERLTTIIKDIESLRSKVEKNINNYYQHGAALEEEVSALVERMNTISQESEKFAQLRKQAGQNFSDTLKAISSNTEELSSALSDFEPAAKSAEGLLFKLANSFLSLIEKLGYNRSPKMGLENN